MNNCNTCQNGYNGSRMQGRFGNQGMQGGARGETPCPCSNSRPRRCMEDDPLSNMAIAMAYVPWQVWGNLYDMDKALKVGTIFEDLDKPFLGRRCGR